MVFTMADCGQTTESKPDASSTGDADAYSGDELRIIVPFQTGGALDVQARLIAKYLGEELDTNVIVENIKGAGGTLGMTQYLKEEANSNVILLTSE